MLKNKGNYARDQKSVLSAVKRNKGNAVKASAYWVWRPKHKVLDHLVYKSVTRRILVLFNDTPCVVLSPDFKLTDQSHVLLKVPRKDNMYSVDLKNVVPQGGLTYLFVKATPDESNLWHRRLGHDSPQQNKYRKGKNTKEAVKSYATDSKYQQLVLSGERSRNPALRFMRPFGCLVTILNTIDHLGKFDGKADERFFVGYSTNSKAFRVFNSRTRIVEENLHLVVVGNQSNGSAGTKAYDDAGKARVEIVPGINYILLPLWTQDPSFSSSPKSSPNARFKPSREEEKKDTKDPRNESKSSGKDSEVLSTEEPREDQGVNQENDSNVNNTNNINIVSLTVNTASIHDNVVDENIVYRCVDDPNMPKLEEIGRLGNAKDDNSGADMNNLNTYFQVSPVPTTRIHKDHPIEAMQEELLQFKLQQVWTLVDLPHGKRAIGTKWVYRIKKDKRGIVIRNKARLVTQGHTQEEGIDYDEVFAVVARIEAIRLFLAYASYKDFVVYQMDVKSAFLYGKIEEGVYVCQPPGFEDPGFPDIVYVDDIIFGSTKKKLCIEFEKMIHKKFQMSSMGELTFFLGLQVKHKEDGIFISQDKYVTEILKKLGFSDVKTAITPMETHKPLLKDADGEDIDEHMYRSMIGSLMYLTSSRPDIMFAVCACVRFQVNPKISHLHAVKRIFRYLKGQPKLGLWYPKDSPFDLVAYINSGYAGASLDRKSTT
ncbi:putative ribonuclease H-like domain-containing protein [Tanacetum coccineum]